jgi:hypothetical protein
MERRPVLELALFGLVAVLGCGPDGIEATTTSCLIAQPIEPGICRVLPTGLVVREQGDVLTDGMLLDDGTIAPLGTLPEAIECHTVLAHDPETGKLWWFEPSEPLEPTSPAYIHQLDLASGTEDWQRELTHEGFSQVRINSMVFHEGALVLAGQVVVFDPDDPWSISAAGDASLLERLDANGATVWAQIGQIGFGLSENETQPLQYAGRLLGIDGGVAFLGSISHPDPEVDLAARTLAIADLATGELLATISLGHIDPWSGFTEFASGGEILFYLLGQLGALDGTAAHTDIVATSLLGEQLWHVDIIWSGFIIANFAQIVLNDAIVHIATSTTSGYTSDIPRTRVEVRSLGGDVRCDGSLPELTELGQLDSMRTWGVRGDRIVLAAELGDGSEVAWMLQLEP